jgi:hypothetical protein
MIKRKILYIWNRFRGVPLILACLALPGCYMGETETEAPDPCLDVAEVCLAACPADSAPTYTQGSSCEASCRGALSACYEHPIASHCYMDPDQVSYDCDGTPAPGGIAAGRTCEYLGLSGRPDAGQHWICK